jgi:hypothetical protein
MIPVLHVSCPAELFTAPERSEGGLAAASLRFDTAEKRLLRARADDDGDG